MRLIITKGPDASDKFEAVVEGETGAAICGRGCSPLEAIGSWAMNYFATGGDWELVDLPLEVVCDPPELLETFKFEPQHASWSNRMMYVLGPADKRD